MTNTIDNTEDMIDSRDVIARIDDLESRDVPRYVAGWNMPGFMPDSEPAEFDNADDALEYIRDAIIDLDEEQARHAGNVDFANSLEADENGELGVNFGFRAQFQFYAADIIKLIATSCQILPIARPSPTNAALTGAIG